MIAAFHQLELGAGDALRQHLRRLHVAAGGRVHGIAGAADDQRGAPDAVQQVTGLVFLAGHHVSEIGFQRREMRHVDFPELLHLVRVVSHELGREHEAAAEVVFHVLRVALLGHLHGRVVGDPALIVLAVVGGAGPGARKDEAVDHLGMVDGDPLAHPSAHGVAHEVGPGEPQRLHEIDAVVGEHPGRVVDVRLVATSRAPVVPGQHPEVFLEFRHLEDLPVVAGHAGAAHQHEGFATAVELVVEIQAADVGDGHG